MASQSEENKMNSEKNTTSDQKKDEINLWGFFLFLFLVLLTMASMFMVAQTWTYQSYTFFYEYDVYGALHIVCNVLGAIVIVNTVVGFLSMFQKNIRMLIVNGVLSWVVFIIILAVLCLALTTDSDVFRASLNIPVQDIKDPEIEAKVSFIQRTLGCCGSNDHRDYLSVQFPTNMSHTIVFKPDESSGDMVAIMLPATCCVNLEEQFCKEMWSTGCKTALVSTMMQKFNLLSAVGGGMMVLNLLTIVMAVLVFRAFRMEKNEKYLNNQIIIVLDAEELHKEKPSNHDNHHQSSLHKL